jgi:hypothetical protein
VLLIGVDDNDALLNMLFFSAMLIFHKNQDRRVNFVFRSCNDRFRYQALKNDPCSLSLIKKTVIQTLTIIMFLSVNDATKMQGLPSSDPSNRDCNGPGGSHHARDYSNLNTSGVNVNVNDNDSCVSNDDLLVVWQGIALLTADCMGVGVLGLPNDIKSLGYVAGFTFLLANFPINYYAGNLLSVLALDLERQHDELQRHHHDHDDDDDDDDDDDCDAKNDTLTRTTVTLEEVELSERTTPQDHSKSSSTSVEQPTTTPTSSPRIHRRRSQEENNTSSRDCSDTNNDDRHRRHQTKQHNSQNDEIFQDEVMDDDQDRNSTDYLEGETNCFTSSPRSTSRNISKDLINITEVTFYPSSVVATATVKTIFYINLFLVLGEYILVMGRSVSAIFADQICLPVAGAIASVLMFGLCQFRTMAKLGRTVSLTSLLALMVVLMQCLFHHRLGSTSAAMEGKPMALEEEEAAEEVDDGIWGMFSSLAGIGFAVGSQKLFLNIRNDLQHREHASKVLGGSLGVYGLAYVVVILLAGPGTLRIDALQVRNYFLVLKSFFNSFCLQQIHRHSCSTRYPKDGVVVSPVYCCGFTWLSAMPSTVKHSVDLWTSSFKEETSIPHLNGGAKCMRLLGGLR